MKQDGTLTVLGSTHAELTEKKSRFLATVTHIETETEATALIEAERKNNRDARHVCFAYLCDAGRTVRMSDDGEPSGTAGAPMLDLLRKRGLTDCLVTVTRYFGGILLGAPGLVRAYAGSAKLALDAAPLGCYRPVASGGFSCSYSEHEKLSDALARAGAREITENYGETVDVSFLCDAPDAERLGALVRELSGARVAVAFGESRSELFPVAEKKI